MPSARYIVPYSGATITEILQKAVVSTSANHGEQGRVILYWDSTTSTWHAGMSQEFDTTLQSAITATNKLSYTLLSDTPTIPTVIANPSEAATAQLSTLQIDDTVYSVDSSNPNATPLTRLKVADTVYNVRSGGSSDWNNGDCTWNIGNHVESNSSDSTLYFDLYGCAMEWLTGKTSLSAPGTVAFAVRTSAGNPHAAAPDYHITSGSVQTPDTTHGLIPSADGNNTIGTSSTAFAQAYIQNVYANQYYTTSDQRLKTNIADYQPKHSILDLPVHTFNIKSDDNTHIGCLAQELQEIEPLLVHTDDRGYLSVEDNRLVYLLLLEVKKLSQEVKDLKQQLNKNPD